MSGHITIRQTSAASSQMNSRLSVQTFYGIRDDLTSTQVTKANLLTQSIVYEGSPTLQTGSTSQKVRVVSASQPTAAHKGWQLDLRPPSPASAQGERSVSMPVLRHGRIIFSTIIPNNDPCSYGGESWLMELDALSGGRLATSVFDLNNDMLIDSGDYVRLPTGEYVPVSGLYNDEMIKTPGIISAGELEYKYTSGSSGSIGIVREKGQLEILGRQSWRQLQ